MKKITALFALLMLVCMGATAQVYVTETGQNMLSLDDMKAGVDAGDFYVSMQQHQTSTHNYINSQGKLQSSYNTDGTTAWKVEKKGSNYVLKSVATGKYISSLAGGGGTAAGFSDNFDDALEFAPVQSTSTDGNVASGYATSQSIWWNIASNPSNRLNTSGQNNIFQNGGTGIWTCIFTYKVTVKYNIVYKCYMQGDTEPFETVTSTDVYADGEGVTITEQMLPAFPGKAVATFDNSVTINGANAEVNVTYTTSTYDYTLVVNNAPEGTAITIKGENATNGASLSFPEAVTESDVNVTLPQTYYTYTVVIEGTTITINIEDTRWPINFPKTQTFTRGDRHINSATFNDQTVDGLYVNQSTLCYQDLTATKTVTLPVNTSVKPSFNVAGGWQHGFVYIDLNNDGDFTDEGELVAKSPTTGSPNLATAIAEFTSPATEGTYRMRIKTDWASEDPGGNTDSGNYIINNGGQIVDLTLVVVGGVEVTYAYKFDGNVVNNETLTVPVGEAFPTPTLPFGFTGSAPEGTVTEADNGTTKEIDMTWTLFRYADSYDNISQWYNVRMHANQTNYLYNNNGAVAFTNAVGKNDYLWGFVGDPINGFQVYNYTAGGSVAIDNTEPASALSADGTSVSFKVASSAQGNNGASADYFFALYVTEGNYLNYQQGQIKRWSDNDAGSTIMINAAQPETDDDIFAAVMAQLDAYTFGDNLGQYGIEGKTADEANAAINRLQTEGYTPENLAEAQALLAAVKYNQPAGKFIRLYNEARDNGVYMGAADSGKHPNVSTVEEAGIYYVTPDSKIISYKNGLYLTNTAGAQCASVSNNEGCVYTFEDAGNGKYYVKNTGYIVAWTETSDRNSTLNDDVRLYGSWGLEEVTELPITLHEATCKDGTTHWFATFSAPVAVSEVVGAEIHKVTDNGSTVYVEPAGVTGIPAGKAVLLVSDTETATVKLGETNDDDFDTALLPLYACEKGKAGFFFGKGGANEYAGFYTIGSETPTGGFKAYIAADSNGAKVLDFGNEATGINTIENGAENGAVYNLQGQRVNKAQKGVFIINNKKVVVK